VVVYRVSFNIFSIASNFVLVVPFGTVCVLMIFFFFFFFLLSTFFRGGDQGAAFKALHNAKYFKESYSLNDKAIAKPPIAWPNSVKAAGFHASARFATLTATSPTDLAYFYEVRLASVTSDSATHHVSHDIAVVLKIGIDYNCHVLTLHVNYVVGQAALDSAPFAALLAANEDECGKGEKHINGTCTPLTCDSPLACPDNACRRVPVNATTGVAFKCGCDKGYELNGHTLRCEAVTCEAPTACRPYSKCVMLPDDTINDCNPTPTMPEQWVRGSKPCRRFECLALP
jgi:hypothetical protein